MAYNYLSISVLFSPYIEGKVFVSKILCFQYFKDKSKDSITAFMKSTLTLKSLQQLDESQKENVEYLAKFAVQMVVREIAKPESNCSMYPMIQRNMYLSRILKFSWLIIWVAFLPFCFNQKSTSTCMHFKEYYWNIDFEADFPSHSGILNTWNT